MEISGVMRMGRKGFRVLIVSVLLNFLANSTLYAQEQGRVYTIKNGKMYIELNKDLPVASLDSFIERYELYDLSLKSFIKTNNEDTLKMRGWRLEKNNSLSFAISKPLIGSEDLNNLAEKILFAGKPPGFDVLFPSENNGLAFGANRFRNKQPFLEMDSVTRFYLRGNEKANRVILAGSFNNWDPRGLQMARTDSGWIADVKLGPGKYWYKFIADGRWFTDNDNQLRENDGMGNVNSVYYKPNYLFRLEGYTDVKKVFVAGSFNNWNEKELLMQRTANGWQLPVYLAGGTHTYRFIINGRWMADPSNPDKYPNEYKEFNSVVRFGKPFIFRLKGYENAQKVILTGNFNGWRKDELFMTRTDSGWVLPYTIGAGNYEYRFVVDGKEITDPANPLLTSDDLKKANSYLIVDPNHTFHLKGFTEAKNVFLSGDFNGFSPNSLPMKREGDGWVFNIHLTRGKHIYKFVVDGNWIRDPQNDYWEQNNYGTGDSVIWFGE